MIKILKTQSGHYVVAIFEDDSLNYFMKTIQVAALLNIPVDTYIELAKRYNGQQITNIYMYENLDDAKGIRDEFESIVCLNTLME